ITNSRFEQCIRGITVGVDDQGVDSGGYLTADGLLMEANNWHIYLNSCSGGCIRNSVLLGDPFNALGEDKPSVVGVLFRSAYNMVIEGNAWEGMFSDATVKFLNPSATAPTPYHDVYNIIFTLTNATITLTPEQAALYPTAKAWKGLELIDRNSVKFNLC